MSIRFSQFGWQVVSNDGLPVYRGTLHGCLSYVEGLQAEWAQLAGIARQAQTELDRGLTSWPDSRELLAEKQRLARAAVDERDRAKREAIGATLAKGIR